MSRSDKRWREGKHVQTEEESSTPGVIHYNKRMLLENLAPIWEKYMKVEKEFDKQVEALTDEMRKSMGINDLIFFCQDGLPCGIGNLSRTLDLIHSTDLEKAVLKKRRG